jgi:hypothetical protein
MYSYPESHKMPLLLIVAGRETALLLLLCPITEGVAMGGRSVVVVRKLLWAVRRRTVVVLMATVGVVLLVGGMALATTPADVPPSDPGSNITDKKYLALAYSRSLHEADNAFVSFSYDGRSGTLGQAKWRAYNECVKHGGRHSAVYKDDCRGIAWVRDGWLAFAVEDLVVKEPGYEPKWGWAVDQRLNKAKGKALQECYEADPRSAECKLDYGEQAGSLDSPSTFNGGTWRTP